LSKKLTTGEWIARATAIWGDKFDYSQSIYEGRHKRIQIICRNCGPLWVPAGNHVQQTLTRKPTGCDTCSRAEAAKNLIKPFNTMVEDARAIHGNRYEYIEDSYISARVGMTIVCPNHGEITITPDSHINARHGCKKCADQRQASETLAHRYRDLNRRIAELSHQTVTLQFQSFKGQNFDAKFTCIIHGAFVKKPIQALQTKHPCPECRLALPNNNSKLTASMLEERVRAMEGSFAVLAINGSGKSARIHIKCNADDSHNPHPPIRPDSLYRKSFACSKCGSIAGQPARTAGLQQTLDNKKSERAAAWEKSAKDYHGDRYDYSLVDYVDAHAPVLIGCPIHGVFTQSAHTHLRAGCRKCADEDLKGRYTHTYFVRYPEEKTKPAYLYHVSFDFFGQELFKVGITTTTIKNRFSAAAGQGIPHQVIAYSKMSLYQAFQKEQALLETCEKTIQDLLSDEECAKLREARIGVTELVDKKLSRPQLREYF